jgi:hypothetical protein
VTDNKHDHGADDCDNHAALIETGDTGFAEKAEPPPADECPNNAKDNIEDHG